MNGSDRILVDTNLLIYFFGGIQSAKQVLIGKEIHFSFITEIELLGNSNISASQEKIIKEFLSFYNKHTYSSAIERMAINIKKTQKVKVPDAIIAATSIVYDIPLLTSDKALSKISDLNCLLFEV